jgi:hypothetical protein
MNLPLCGTCLRSAQLTCDQSQADIIEVWLEAASHRHHLLTFEAGSLSAAVVAPAARMQIFKISMELERLAAAAS